MWDELRAFFREPGPERPPGPSPWDRRLVLALVPTAVAEGLLREGLAMRPLQIAVGVALVCTVGFRRMRPLGASAAAFGLGILVTLTETLLGLPEIYLYTSLCVLLLPYSLLRWGAGREIAVGLAFIVGAYATAALCGTMHEAADFIGAAVVLLLPGALGASLRFRAQAHRREVEHAKLRERAQIARDLHDTVAHHVVAIAIQAQAGRAVLSSRPDATLGTLEAIEKEAAHTLSELRSMVRTLRDDRDPNLEPQPLVADIERLARRMRGVPVVEVELDPGLERLRSAVQSALYRIAQESITNAVRHARGASRVRVRVTAEGATTVRLTVRDDGAALSTRPSSGFGLVGMAERAALLGGKLEAGPRGDGGWTVEVVLPRDGESQ